MRQRSPTLRLAVRRRDRGAAAVEAAIVLPVILLVFVGILEFGLYFKDALAVSSGVRAAGRTASSLPYANTNARFATEAARQVALSIAPVNVAGTPVLYVYDPGATASVDPFTTCSVRCLKFTWNATTGTFNAPTGSWAVCGSVAAVHDTVGVAFTAQHPALTGIGPGSFTIREKAILAFEPTASTTACQ